jgi:hypothetical protein
MIGFFRNLLSKRKRRTWPFGLIGSVPIVGTEHVVSTLDDAVACHIGRLIDFRTLPGWGWIGTPPEEPVPPPFSAHLLRFFEWRGNRRGGIAKVEEKGHVCDGLWVLFATRHVGVFDFTERITHYNVALLEVEPSDPVDNGTFWVIDASPMGLRFAGFATVVAAQSV